MHGTFIQYTNLAIKMLTDMTERYNIIMHINAQNGLNRQVEDVMVSIIASCSHSHNVHAMFSMEGMAVDSTHLHSCTDIHACT